MFEPVEPLSRRTFLAAVALAGATRLATAGQPAKTLRDFLKPYVLERASVEMFLDPQARVWAKFHPTYGYLLRNSLVRDGMDGSHTLARYETTGQRMQVNFRDQPCRINTYGDSFTQGHQVSDGETWQEVLAAHFCEPIRNFGIGGFGVYQAYRRLLDVESTDLGDDHLIFNIWGDDHFRSIYAWRWLSFPTNALARWSGTMLHSNPWVHARLDPQTEALVERPNLCPDETSLRKLCDEEFVYETFGRDEVVLAIFASRTGIVENRQPLNQMAAMLGDRQVDWTTPESVRTTANRLLHSYGVRVGIEVIKRAHQFAKSKNKKLLVLLSYPSGSIRHACLGTPPGSGPDNIDWHPKEFKESLTAAGIPFIDSLPKHVAEFRGFKLSPNDYVNRYYIGHYTPRGNHFFAYAIKNEVVAWLDPKPPTYSSDEQALRRLKGYLPG